MIELLTGSLRRYHIEAAIDDNNLAITYRAFARRKTGKGIIRRYFAIIEKKEEASQTDFNAAIQETVLTAPFPIHIEENIKHEDCSYVVLAKGEAPRAANPLWKSLQNRGYLMLFLSAFILILLIVRFFQSSDAEEQPPVSDSIAIESVDL